MTIMVDTLLDTSGPHASGSADLGWLREFEQKHGRPLRVLHVGNVANNAYLNAKFLRDTGIDCHVLSADYYDPLATPEWETGQHVPRPRWFVQGPFPVSAAYLQALGSGNRLRQWLLWQRLRIARGSAPQPASRVTAARLITFVRFWLVVLRYKLWHAPLRRLRYSASWLWSLARFLARRSLRASGIDVREPPLGEPLRAADGEVLEPLPVQSSNGGLKQDLIERFANAFPQRSDTLSLADFNAWESTEAAWRRLFDSYDIVQCYATDPIRALLTGKRPYVAYEHGTLRVFTMGDDPTHRLTALAYRESDHAFITNGDCLAYAQRLGMTQFSPMVHTVDVAQHEQDFGNEPGRIRASLGAEILLFCPLRHDWAIKGTDIHLRALPRILSETQGRVLLVLTDWGAEVQQSKELIRQLGCESNVIWLRPLSRLNLIKYMKAADVLLDQIALPHFGATAPQGLAAGVPVIMSYRPESTEWIVDEPAPILPAFDSEGVAEAVRTALDPAWRAEFAVKARDWVHRYHHPDRVVAEHCRVYRRLLEGHK